MDVNLVGVGNYIQEFIRELIEINDWIFYKVHLSEDLLDYPVQPPTVTVGHMLRCFGCELDEDEAKIKFTTTPAKGPHACGTLHTTREHSTQFYLGGSGIQLYLAPVIEVWYLVNRGVEHSAVKLDTFDRIGLVFSDGRHRGVRNIIMGDDSIDLRMSDEDDDVISLHVVN